MSADTTTESTAATGLPWWNLHARLMPDYNPKATIYWWCVVLLGSAVCARAIAEITAAGGDAWLHVAVCGGLAMLAGLVPVRVPGAKNSFTAGEIFIFVLVLIDGVDAAALACACEAFAGSARTTRRWTSRIASPAMAAISLFVSGGLMKAASALLATVGLTGAYFGPT